MNEFILVSFAVVALGAVFALYVHFTTTKSKKKNT